MLFSCATNTNTEKNVNRGNNSINVKDKVIEIPMDEVLIGPIARLDTSDDYLVIKDIKTYDMYVHLLDKNSLEYITSALPKGQGPGEITIIGHISLNEKDKELYISDHGKNKIFTYPLDSILNNEYYIPETKIEMKESQFPSDYELINDTLAYARIIEPTGNSGHNELLAKWNMQTGETFKIPYSNPKVDKKRITLAASKELNTLVECYHNLDLMTIMDLDGNLKHNIYGPNWNSRDETAIHHFGDVLFRKDKIIASYSGGDRLTEEYLPTKIYVFDLNGNNLQTLDIGYRISDICYDDEYDRLIMVFDDEIQFGYLDLEGIVD